MSAVEIRGLEALRRRFAAASSPQPVKAALREAAEAVAAEAARAAPGELGQTVEIIDQSRETRSAYAIGTRHRAGRFLEFGTLRRGASPWLWPAFLAHTRGINHRLRKVIATAFKI